MFTPLTRQQLGARGEKVAERFLRKLGYRILSRNFRCPVGELDLVCFHDETIVFVEVKTLACDAKGDPEEHVNAAKRRKLYQVARAYLQYAGRPECAYRFDVVSVVLPPDNEPTIRHFVDAFRPPP